MLSGCLQGFKLAMLCSGIFVEFCHKVLVVAVYGTAGFGRRVLVMVVQNTGKFLLLGTCCGSIWCESTCCGI